MSNTAGGEVSPVSFRIDGLGGYDRVNVFGLPTSSKFHALNNPIYLNLIGVVPSTVRQPFVEKGVVVEGIVNC